MGPRAHLRHRHGRPSTPSWRLGGDEPLRWRAPPGGAVPAPALQARPAAPRRAHQPPRRRVRRLARKDVAGLPGHRRRRHPRPLLLGQRGWLDPRARPRAGIPWEGNYSSWLEQKQARLAGEEKADRSRQAALERELEWIRMSPRARQSKGKARINAYNDLVAEAEAAERRADKFEITIPPGPRLGDRVVEAADVTKDSVTASSSTISRSSCRREGSSG